MTAPDGQMERAVVSYASLRDDLYDEVKALRQENDRLRKLAGLQPDGLSLFNGTICLDYENPDDRERAFDLLEGLFSTATPEPRP